ncbi:MAG: transposase [Gammaproteobacteria bacterium]|nr:transposase [Gammaproteobacteria bacterium]
MRTSKFSESQIVGMLREAESGVPVADVLRRHDLPCFFGPIVTGEWPLLRGPGFSDHF